MTTSIEPTDDGETVSYYYRKKVEKEIEDWFCGEDWMDYYCNCECEEDDYEE